MATNLLKNGQTILTVLCGFGLVLAFFGVPYAGLFSVACGSYFALKSGWESVRERSLDVNFLMILAAAGAVAIGHVTDAAALLFLFSLSSTLEAQAMGKTMSAIEALMKLKPDKAIRVRDEGDEEIPASDVQVGDLLRVLPFEPIPTDGTLASEEASLNESSMTGESRSISKRTGDSLMAGTQNLDSMLLMRATTAPGDSTLDRIMTLVQEAQENKGSGERISLWFGQRYTLFVMAAFLISLLLRTVATVPFGDALYQSLILLVALSPCALVISTPATTLSALAYAARRGILVRGGQYIELAGMVDTVAIDKTGTLTKGEPEVVEVCLYSSELAKVCASGPDHQADCIHCWHSGEDLQESTREALRLAASAETFSTHPIADAIVRKAKDFGGLIPDASSHRAVPGMGIEAEVGGKMVKIGQRKFFGEDLPEAFRLHTEEMQARGLTAVVMAFGEDWASIGLQDQLRPESASTLDAFRKSGIQSITMLTGDNEATARAVASELHIQDVHAGISPEDKAIRIQSMEQQGHRTLMVGDGVNDAPALASATIGVAMGGLGSEAALRAADVVLIQDRIERLPELISLGRAANRTIRVNLFFAGGMILTLTLLSLVWKFVPFLTQFGPNMPLPMAVIGHEGSTVLVILNGLRLLRGPQ